MFENDCTVSYSEDFFTGLSLVSGSNTYCVDDVDLCIYDYATDFDVSREVIVNELSHDFVDELSD